MKISYEGFTLSINFSEKIHRALSASFKQTVKVCFAFGKFELQGTFGESQGFVEAEKFLQNFFYLEDYSFLVKFGLLSNYINALADGPWMSRGRDLLVQL